MLRKLFSIFLLFAVLLVSQSGIAQPSITIGVVIDGSWQRNDEIREMTEAEIRTLTQGEFDVRFPAEKRITADWTLEGVRQALDQLLQDPEVDLMLAMGALASGDISSRGELPKPVVAPFVIDAVLQGLPSKNGGSGVKNLNYLSLPARALTDIRLFHEIVWFDTLTVLINSEVWDSVPELTPRLRAATRELNVEPVLLPVERTIDSALSQLTSETDAVYVAPLLHLQPGEFDKLVDHLTEMKIPSFSLLGVGEVERGILATASPDIFPKLTRRVALNVQRILLGEEPGNLPTAFAVGEQLFINMAIARKIRVSPPFSVMTEAVLINEEREDIERTVDFAGVMRDAVDRNLDLAAERKFVAAGQQNVNLARSQLLPQVSVSALGVIIDEDRAEASLGSQTERTLSGSASARQLIFSERAWANVSIQKSIQLTRKQQLEQLRLDIVRDAAISYLNVLSAKTFEEVQKENLKRTRSNLELAKVRKSIGYSGPSEVYRWESQIANARRDVIDAIAQRNLAEIALNQLLHRPAEDPFDTKEASINDPAVPISKEGLVDFFDDYLSFKTFRSFMVGEGINRAPELQALRAAMSAKQRELKSATRSFFSPTVALEAEVSKKLSEGGAGLEGFELPPELPVMFPEVDDTDWSIAINLSLPIFEGGGRFAERSRARKELDELQLTYDAVAEKIEQRVRSALHLAGASRAGIQLAHDAEDAARKNLELVTDAYSRGGVDVLDLLDAQNAALNSELNAANAVYDFLSDIVEVERAIGGFYFFATPQERAEWSERLEDYFRKEGVSPDGR